MQRSLHSRVLNASHNAQRPDNSRQMDEEISELDLAFASVTIMKFLHDTTDVTQLLLDDFKQFNGYEFLMQYVLR